MQLGEAVETYVRKLPAAADLANLPGMDISHEWRTCYYEGANCSEKALANTLCDYFIYYPEIYKQKANYGSLTLAAFQKTPDFVFLKSLLQMEEVEALLALQKKNNS